MCKPVWETKTQGDLLHGLQAGVGDQDPRRFATRCASRCMRPREKVCHTRCASRCGRPRPRRSATRCASRSTRPASARCATRCASRCTTPRRSRSAAATGKPRSRNARPGRHRACKSPVAGCGIRAAAVACYQPGCCHTVQCQCPPIKICKRVWVPEVRRQQIECVKYVQRDLREEGSVHGLPAWCPSNA